MKGTITALNDVVGPTGEENKIGRDDVIGVFIGGGDLVGTVELQASFDDGSTWETVESGTWSSFPVSRRVFRIDHHNIFRVKCTAYTSGSTPVRLSNLGDD